VTFAEARQIAKQKHTARQREGHKMPAWEGLSETMRIELTLQEMANGCKPNDENS
jgi:hypothetical protein